MSVYFHGSFGLNRERMASLLKRALKNPKATDLDLAAPAGYGAPYSKRYRSWLHKCGITEMGLPMRLTDKGKVLAEKDPEIQSLTSQWFIHWELTADPERAEAWHFFANDFLPEFKTFTREDLIDGLTEKLRYHSEIHFGPGSKLNRVIARKLIDCYTSNDALGPLGLIEVVADRRFKRQQPRKMGPWATPQSLQSAY